LGPLSAPPPVLNEGSRHTVGPDEMIEYDHLPVRSLIPERGAEVRITEDLSLAWTVRPADDGRLEFQSPRNRPVAYYAASYITTDRWIRADLTVDSDRPIAVYLNGECLGTQNGNKELRSTAELTQGSHLIVVKWLSDPEIGSPGGIRGGLSLTGPFADASVRPTLDPQRFINITNVLDDPRPHNAYISPDGELAAVRISTPVGTSADRESWIRIFRTRDGSPWRTFRGGFKVDDFAWAPDGTRFSYVERVDGKAALWIVEMETGDKRAILEDVVRFGSYEWSPTGSFIVFSVQQEDEEDESFMRRISKPVERWHGWSTRSFLHLVQIPSGARQRLTAGELSTSLQSISPDGNTILFTRTAHDFSERPFSFSELYSLDLRTMNLDTIAVGPWSADASWSPDGNFILILGGPSFFGEAGIAVPDATIPNEYDR
jgi:hypothetical protein